MVKGNKNFRLVQSSRSRGIYLDVILRSTGEKVASVSEFRDSSSWRFTLVNYPHNHSKMFGTLKACLAAIEEEVL